MRPTRGKWVGQIERGRRKAGDAGAHLARQLLIAGEISPNDERRRQAELAGEDLHQPAPSLLEAAQEIIGSLENGWIPARRKVRRLRRAISAHVQKGGA